MNLLDKIKKNIKEKTSVTNEKVDYEKYYNELMPNVDEILNEYIDSKELANKYLELWSKCNNENKDFDFEKWEKNNDDLYRIKMPLEQSIKIAHEFYNSINSTLGNEFTSILNGKDGIKVEMGKVKDLFR